jgi:hypothetical protein
MSLGPGFGELEAGERTCKIALTKFRHLSLSPHAPLSLELKPAKTVIFSTRCSEISAQKRKLAGLDQF